MLAQQKHDWLKYSSPSRLILLAYYHYLLLSRSHQLVRKEVLTILQICRLISSLISSWTVRSSTGTPSLRNAHVGECFLCSDLKVPKTCGDTLDQTLQIYIYILTDLGSYKHRSWHNLLTAQGITLYNIYHCYKYNVNNNIYISDWIQS